MISNTDDPKKIGDLLVKKGIIDESQLDVALKEQSRTKEFLGEVLKGLGFASEGDIAQGLADQIGVEHISLSKTFIDTEAIQLIPEPFARKNRLLPISLENNTISIGMVRTFDTSAIDQIERMTNMQVEVFSITEGELNDTIEKVYGLEGSFERIIEDCIKEADDEKELSSRNKELDIKDSKTSPTIKLVNQIINFGITKGATDIHIEPEEKVVRVRYRIDGVLNLGPSLPNSVQSSVTARIKILSAMNISESRIPQDGRIRVSFGTKKIDLRVSTLPSVYGETVVMRILDKSKMSFGLAKLGFSDINLKIFKEVITKPNGIILVTGPTGSGKTTTLYTALTHVSTIEKKIITMEDPVEYELPIIRQSQINEKAGMTFAAGLRAILRQDPDIILIGEMRDQETAEMAIRAALTGHLVFSTLHTNDAAGAIPRILDMGIDPFLPASSIVAVLAQRLIKTICPNCKEEVEPSPVLLKTAKIEEICKGKKFHHGKGCQKCSYTGYKGRNAIHEILIVTPRISELVMQRANGNEIMKVAIEEDGMRSMVHDGLDKVFEGVTTIEEIVATVHT